MLINEKNGYRSGSRHYSPVFGKYYRITGNLTEEITKDEYEKNKISKEFFGRDPQVISESIEVKIDPKKLDSQMRKLHYDSDAYLDMIEDSYNLTDGEDYSVSRDGLTFTFSSHISPNEIKSFRKDLEA